MIEFAWSYLFLLLPMPYVLRYARGIVKNTAGAAVRVPFFLQVRTLRYRKTAAFWKMPVSKTLYLATAWFFLVCAAARPQLPIGGQSYQFPVRDIIMAIDISASMKSQDFLVSKDLKIRRIEGVQNVADTFIKKRKGDRIGLIVFGGQANLYVPLTVDYTAARNMLQTLTAGLLGGMTAIGDAVGLSVRYLRESEAKHKIIVLLTDGLNNAGNIMPLDALKSAVREKVTIYVIGVGNPEDGKEGLDEKLLKKMAQATGGIYYFAGSEKELQQAYKEIANAEPLSQVDVFLVPKKELYPYPLFVFLCLMSLLGISRLHNVYAYRRQTHDEF